MATSRRIRRPILSGIASLFLIVTFASCGSEVEASNAPSQAGVLSGDPLSKVPIEERWKSLSAYNSRRQSVGDWEGKRDGFRTLWHDNGVKKGEGEFRNDKKQGPWIWWYESGQQRWQGSYVDDRPDGFERAWYSNGQLEYEGSFKDDKRDGLFVRNFETGQPELRGEYKEGRREGVFKYWRYDGSLDRERSGFYGDDVKVRELSD